MESRFYEENIDNTTYEYKLEIFKIVEDTDLWPLIDIIVASSPEDCLTEAEYRYNQDEYHWVIPVVA
jgi:hypothetical protein